MFQIIVKAALVGKTSIYIKKISDRKWSKPLNAGSVINTIYDEESVRFSKTGDTLWFSSKGHNSIGGFDIFYSVKNKSGDWDTCEERWLSPEYSLGRFILLPFTGE